MTEEKPLITIERTGCYGNCPVYSASIFPDGTVVYKGEYWVKVTGESRLQISEAKVNELIEAFEAVGFFSFKDLYSADTTCGPSTILVFDHGGRRKRVVNEYGFSVPRDLERLENKVDRLAGLKALIGKRGET